MPMPMVWQCQVGILASILNQRTKNDFNLTLKSAVFKNLLRQDIEFFDKKQTGVLQERLNHDTAALSATFDIPRDILRDVTFALSSLSLLWRKSATLTLIGAASLPVVAIMQYVAASRRTERRSQARRLGASGDD